MYRTRGSNPMSRQTRSAHSAELSVAGSIAHGTRARDSTSAGTCSGRYTRIGSSPIVVEMMSPDVGSGEPG